MVSLRGDKTRFDGIRRLYGDLAFAKIQQAHVMVVGVGGVGCWVVEALARSGIGQITMVDYDDVCESNINRQVHALTTTIGRPKTSVLQDRILQINPDCNVAIRDFMVTQESVDEVLAGEFDCVVDCIDQGHNKLYLAAACRALNIPLVVVGRAGGLQDPGLIKVADLSQTSVDGILANLRKWLRCKYNFPRGKGVFDIPTVFSEERPKFIDACGELTTERPPETEGTMDCQTGFGTSMMVTATFGLFAANEAIKIVTKV